MTATTRPLGVRVARPTVPASCCGTAAIATAHPVPVGRSEVTAEAGAPALHDSAALLCRDLAVVRASAERVFHAGNCRSSCQTRTLPSMKDDIRLGALLPTP